MELAARGGGGGANGVNISVWRTPPRHEHDGVRAREQEEARGVPAD